MKILSIETSCDETGLALVEASGGLYAPKFKVLKNLVSSQIKIHRPFGGVVPNLAKREHLKNLPLLLKRIMNQDLRFKNKKNINHKSKFLNQIDLIAVTVGPGLEPALWAGITFAQELAREYKKPLIGANHLEGHMYSFLLPQKTANTKSKILNTNYKIQDTKKLFPAIALSVSGGHTNLLLMKSLTKWKKLGETRDDAAGEAFDKVARMLNLPYPGGPEIERLALSLPKGEKPSITFPRPMLNQKNYDFSFSGLKTSVFYYLLDLGFRVEGIANNKNLNPIPYTLVANICASFQQAVIDVLISKTMRAAGEYGARSLILCGGVAANKKLKRDMKQETRDMGISFFAPHQEYNGDNAAMIAVAGYFASLRRKKLPLVANGDLEI